MKSPSVDSQNQDSQGGERDQEDDAIYCAAVPRTSPRNTHELHNDGGQPENNLEAVQDGISLETPPSREPSRVLAEQLVADDDDGFDSLRS